MHDHLWNMSLALDLAEKAYKQGEVPVGAIIVDGMGKKIAEAHNLKEQNHDPCGHAELIAIREAAKKQKAWRLTDCTVYVTLEPCPMCLSAMVQARVKSCVFGAYDHKGGALTLGYHNYKDSRLNHRFDVMGGVKHFECSKILSDFFRERRSGHN